MKVRTETKAEYDRNRKKDARVKAGSIFTSQVQKSKKRGHSAPEYTREHFVDWCLSDATFCTLHKEWVESDMATELAPSIDRINDYKGYSFDNIQVMTWKENNKKARRDVINGVNNKNNRAVFQLSLDGDLIKEHYSVMSAGRCVGIRDTNIHRVCRGGRKTAGGFRWEFKCEEVLYAG